MFYFKTLEKEEQTKPKPWNLREKSNIPVGVKSMTKIKGRKICGVKREYQKNIIKQENKTQDRVSLTLMLLFLQDLKLQNSL